MYNLGEVHGGHKEWDTIELPNNNNLGEGKRWEEELWLSGLRGSILADHNPLSIAKENCQSFCFSI